MPMPAEPAGGGGFTDKITVQAVLGGCALEIELDRNGVQTRIVVSESVKKGSLGQK